MLKRYTVTKKFLTGNLKGLEIGYRFYAEKCNFKIGDIIKESVTNDKSKIIGVSIFTSNKNNS